MTCEAHRLVCGDVLGSVLSVNCSDKTAIIFSQCPASNVVRGSSAMGGGCEVLSSSSSTTTCLCSLTSDYSLRRKLSESNHNHTSVNFVAMSLLVGNDFPETWRSSDRLSQTQLASAHHLTDNYRSCYDGFRCLGHFADVNELGKNRISDANKAESRTLHRWNDNCKEIFFWSQCCLMFFTTGL